MLGDDGVQKLKIEINSLQGEGKIKNDAYQKKAHELEYKAQNQMLQLVQKSVAKIAKKEGYTMIIDAQSLQYSEPGLNITEKVLADLK